MAAPGDAKTVALISRAGNRLKCGWKISGDDWKKNRTLPELVGTFFS
jgi:hypothetical protein